MTADDQKLTVVAKIVVLQKTRLRGPGWLCSGD